MPKLLTVGAAGSLGGYVTRRAVAMGHEVSGLVRDPAKLPDELRDKMKVHQADLSAMSSSSLEALVSDRDAVINTAGLVTKDAGSWIWSIVW